MTAPDLAKSGLYLASGPTAGYDGVTRATYTTAAAKPLPSPVPVPAGWAVESTGRSSVVYREVPAIAPPPQKPAVTPQKPAVTPVAKRTLLTHNGVYSVNHVADQVIRDVLVRGLPQNIVAQNYQGGLLIDNVVSLDATGTGQFDGQTLYCDSIAGPITITNSYFGWAGRPRNIDPQPTPTQFSQCAYINGNGKMGAVTITGNIFAGAANAGVQCRSLAGALITGNLFLDCGTALDLIMGGATLEGNLIYGGNYFFDGTAPTGNTAIRSYWTLLAKNNLVIARPNQGAMPAWPAHPPGTIKGPYPQAGLNVGGQWVHTNPSWTPPPGYPNLAEYFDPESSGNVIAAEWPGGVSMGPTKLPGWTVRPACVDYDYRPALKAVEDGGSVADAITRVTADLKALLPGRYQVTTAR